MALLAGPKRKQKLGFDPNNTNWAKDSSAVGQSLLKKMGWTEGAGLGANEDGIVVPIKASMKSDSRGLGCTALQADAWIAHQEEFDKILASLNVTTDKEGSAKDPSQDNESNGDAEEKKEEGQRRFYGRFSRGGVKQLRTTEDLDCILGRRKSTTKAREETKKKKKEEVKETKESESNDEETDKRHGFVTVTSACSVQDYFAQKMKTKNLPPMLQQKKSEEESRENGEEQKLHKETFTSGGCTVQDYFAEKMRAKKAKQAGTAQEVSNTSLNTEVEICDVEICKEDTSEKSNGDCDVPGTVGQDIDADTKGKKKKKRKKKKKASSESAESDNLINVSSDVEVVELLPTKETKSGKRKAVDVVEIISDVGMDSGNGRKKKKLKLDTSLQNCNDVSVISVGSDSEDENDQKSKKSKEKGNWKKRDLKVKETCDESNVIVVDENEEVEDDVEIVELDTSQNKKKNKKKKKKTLPEDGESEIEIIQDELNCGGKKKKKDIKVDENVEDKGKEDKVQRPSLTKSEELEIEENNNEKVKQGNKNSENVNGNNERHLKRMQNHILKKRRNALSLKDMMKVLDKSGIRTKLGQLANLSNDILWDEVKVLKQADLFHQRNKDLCRNLKAKLIKKQTLEKQGESAEGKRKEVRKEIKKFKKSAIKELEKMNDKLCVDAQAFEVRAIKKLKKKRRRNTAQTNELMEEMDASFDLDLPTQLELINASYKSNNSQVKKTVEDAKEHLNKILNEFIEGIKGLEVDIEDEVHNDVTLQSSQSTPNKAFPGAVEVDGYLRSVREQ